MIALLPCPFCGGEASLSIGEQNGQPRHYVECLKCAACADMTFSEATAAYCWNARTHQWQPIETAPRDGEWIMAYWPTMGIGMFPFVVFWDEGWEPASHYARDYGEVYPTHWMPLPPPPTPDR